MSSFLAQWFDPALKISAEETKQAIERAEVQRLAKLLAVATQAQTIPRRVGADASAEDLAQDKRKAKRIAHVASQLLAAWGGKPNNGVGDISREAAQVEWQHWWDDHRIWLLNRQRYIATWCLTTEADPKWCKSALVKLNNELQWLTYALR